MRFPSLKRPSPALAVSIAALVVAAGGTSYAAARIGTNDIQNGAVTSEKIRNNDVQSKDVQNGTIRNRDLRPNLKVMNERWVLINAAGQIEAQSGGFSVTAAYPTLDNTAPPGSPPNAARANGNVYINANEPLGNNGIVGTIALQNTVDQNTDMITNGRAPGDDKNPEFSGEMALSQCGTAITACAPPGTANDNHFVVSPRLSNGGFTTADNRKRFYVTIVGDSRDSTGPAAEAR